MQHCNCSCSALWSRLRRRGRCCRPHCARCSRCGTPSARTTSIGPGALPPAPRPTTRRYRSAAVVRLKTWPSCTPSIYYTYLDSVPFKLNLLWIRYPHLILDQQFWICMVWTTIRTFPMLSIRWNELFAASRTNRWRPCTPRPLTGPWRRRPSLSATRTCPSTSSQGFAR